MASKNPKKEPTLREVANSQNKMMSILLVMKDRVDNVDVRLSSIERRLSGLENRVEDVAETLDAVAEAVSKDSEILIAHERRIKKLERV